MKHKKIAKLTAAVMSVMLCTGMVVPAIAASSTVTTNNTATSNDLANSDIIDMSKTGSLTIYKYDITAAEAAGDYEEGTYKATGERDSRVETAMADYAIEGVQFSYLRVGNVETHSTNNGTESSVQIVYEIPTALANILGLTPSEAVDMNTPSVSDPCSNTGVYHYTSDQIQNALEDILEADDVAAKNVLEDYLYDYGTMDSTTDQGKASGVVNMPKTDENGRTYAGNLQLGLYLVVETEVPEQVVETVNPWFVQIPFTNTSAQTSEDGVSYGTNGEHDSDGVTNSGNASGTEANVSGGEQWLYDMTCYPKNQTGNPTLDKAVRNAYSNTSQTDKNGTVNSGDEYVSSSTSDSLVVYNDDTNALNKADTDDDAYVANRGGYTSDGITAGAGGQGYSQDFAYNDVTTASEGDVLDYILISRLPHISSKATFLSEYTFTDTLCPGITYNQDTKIAFYNNADDANANNTKDAVLIWNSDSGKYTQTYGTTSEGESTMTVKLTESGLQTVNGTTTNNPAGAADLDGLSDYYMVVYYTATVNSDDSVVLGDDGNPNDVALLWSRTSDGYYNMLEDRNYVYTFGVDLLKTFSDNNGDFSNVQFKLYNSTDAYYVVAKRDSDGTYYVTGKTIDEAEATTFIPAAADGSLLVNGIEADEYQLTEVATDDGYNLLKDQIEIDIISTNRDIIAAVAGVTGLDPEDANAIIGNYHGGIYDENGNLVNNQKDEVTGATVDNTADEDPNGRTIGKTDMYVSAIREATATVDGIDANMTGGNGSVIMTVNNTKRFLLPRTGGAGLYAVTIIGVAAVAGGCFLITRRKKNS